MSLFTTILAGVTVFVLGQIFLRWVIEPIQELRKLKGEILFLLANDHQAIHNANAIDENEALKVVDTLYRLGASLHATLHLIPLYSYIRKVFFLPEVENIKFASKRLRLIANSMFSENNDINYRLDLYRIQICEALNIDDPIENGMSKQELIKAIDELRGIKTHNKALND